MVSLHLVTLQKVLWKRFGGSALKAMCGRLQLTIDIMGQAVESVERVVIVKNLSFSYN
jgi:hypothetical protein